MTAKRIITFILVIYYFITRFEGKCKYFSSIKLDSSWKLALSRNVLTNHRFYYIEGTSTCQTEHHREILSWIL